MIPIPLTPEREAFIRENKDAPLEQDVDDLLMEIDRLRMVEAALADAKSTLDPGERLSVIQALLGMLEERNTYRAEVERLQHQAVHCGECSCEGWLFDPDQGEPVPCPECNPRGLPPRD
jgi:hypothetical protein